MFESLLVLFVSMVMLLVGHSAVSLFASLFVSLVGSTFVSLCFVVCCVVCFVVMFVSLAVSLVAALFASLTFRCVLLSVSLCVSLFVVLFRCFFLCLVCRLVRCSPIKLCLKGFLLFHSTPGWRSEYLAGRKRPAVHRSPLFGSRFVSPNCKKHSTYTFLFYVCVSLESYNKRKRNYVLFCTLRRSKLQKAR